MFNLTKHQLEELEKFCENYINSENPASGSVVDANANVTEKNVTTMMSEFVKPLFIQYNRHKRYNQISEDFGLECADQYLKDIKDHIIYIHDETSPMIPYCMSISLYPFLMNGSLTIGGNTEKPKHLSSFCGGFINAVNQIASQVAGAVATPAFLVCFDYFARKDYGDNYLETNIKEIQQAFQHVVYFLNEPAAGRNSQSLFWNLSMFDDHYLKGMYSDFVYPDDFSKVNFNSVAALQKTFLTWFNKERSKKLLTFPVITCAMLYDENKKVKDREFLSYIAKEQSEGNAFFIYLSDNIDSLSSCCRLRNESKNEFSYTLGNIGEQTGSIHVITINMNRFIQVAHKAYNTLISTDLSFDAYLKMELQDLMRRIHKYHFSTRMIYRKLAEQKMYPAYNANYIDMKRQFSTIGINGLVEGGEYLGYDITPNDDYMNFCSNILKIISDENKAAKSEYKIMFNTEFVPAENLGVKNAMWDKKHRYRVNRDCYNSYFYKVEDDSLSVFDKAKLHGEQVTKYLDGGSAYHINLDDYLDIDQYIKLIDGMALVGVNYFCTNIKVTICEDCGHIDKKTVSKCLKCSSENISYATRVIGYLRKIKNFSKDRQIEESKRFYQ